MIKLKTLLFEVQPSKNNIVLFKKKYDSSLSDDEIKSIFDKFNKKQSFLKNKDIFKYDSIEDLNKSLTAKSKSEKVKDVKQSGVELQYEDSNYLLYLIKNKEASCYYGSGTKWCISGKNDNRFDEYNKKYDIYFVIDKKDSSKKLAITTFKHTKFIKNVYDVEDLRILEDKIPFVIRNQFKEWKDFVWNGDIWYDGTWKGGTWKDGVWENGKWIDGTWKDGTWKRGYWFGGVWENGKWFSGTWWNGTWKGGIWEDGLWKKGTWMGGSWVNGTWQGGWIYDPDKKGNFEEDWEWNDKYVRSPISPAEYF